jgi:outer membrane protein assembly factor BamB
VVCLAACSSGSPPVASSSRVTPSPSPAISTEWTEYHRDAGRSGVGPAEPALSGARVAWSASVDGDVYASPLIVSGHVVVATEDNTVYSLDLFTGSVVWKTHLGDPVDASSLPCGDIRPITGITATPAADVASGRLYVVAFLHSHHHMLFALSLLDGSVAWQQDVDPQGSNPSVQQFRGALAVGSGFVYVPVGGLFGDCGAYNGYVVEVPVGGGQGRAYRVPASRGASIWSPQGVTMGADGSLYVVTGNAVGRSTFASSNSVIELAPDLSVKSYFAPANWASLDASDTDLGSVGATVLSSGLVVAIGKEGVAYVLRAGALGGIGGQVASRKVCAGAWGGTASSGSTVYVPCVDGLFALSVTESSIDVNWFTGSSLSNASPIVSAGAIWAIDSSSATLYALDPSNGRNVLFKTSLGAAEHFSTPAATDGFVVAPAGQKVVAVSVVG